MFKVNYCGLLYFFVVVLLCSFIVGCPPNGGGGGTGNEGQGSLEGDGATEGEPDITEGEPDVTEGEVGNNYVTVPNVVGLGQNAAEALLSNIGLTSNVIYDHSDNVSAGDVISQSPVAGTSVTEGRIVLLLISLGTDASEGDGEPVVTEGEDEEEGEGEVQNIPPNGRIRIYPFGRYSADIHFFHGLLRSRQCIHHFLRLELW